MTALSRPPITAATTRSGHVRANITGRARHRTQCPRACHPASADAAFVTTRTLSTHLATAHGTIACRHLPSHAYAPPQLPTSEFWGPSQACRCPSAHAQMLKPAQPDGPTTQRSQQSSSRPADWQAWLKQPVKSGWSCRCTRHFPRDTWQRRLGLGTPAPRCAPPGVPPHIAWPPLRSRSAVQTTAGLIACQQAARGASRLRAAPHWSQRQAAQLTPLPQSFQVLVGSMLALRGLQSPRPIFIATCARESVWLRGGWVRAGQCLCV